VAFGGERNGVWNIYAVSKRTKRVAQLTRFTSLDGFARYASWSPTGRRIVFERAVYQGSLWTFKLP
jgi:Tol biopolymer transport system component